MDSQEAFVVTGMTLGTTQHVEERCSAYRILMAARVQRGTKELTAMRVSLKTVARIQLYFK